MKRASMAGELVPKNYDKNPGFFKTQIARQDEILSRNAPSSGASISSMPLLLRYFCGTLM